MSTAIAFRDQHGIEFIDYLTHGESLNAIEVYAVAIASYSYAAIVSVSYTEGKDIDDLPAQGTGDYADIRLIAKIFLRDNDTQKLYCAVIRAPKASMFDDTKNGLQVKKTVGDAIATKYSQLAGQTFTFEYGALCGSTQ
jgi:hypothetical protein